MCKLAPREIVSHRKAKIYRVKMMRMAGRQREEAVSCTVPATTRATTAATATTVAATPAATASIPSNRNTATENTLSGTCYQRESMRWQPTAAVVAVAVAVAETMVLIMDRGRILREETDGKFDYWTWMCNIIPARSAVANSRVTTLFTNTGRCATRTRRRDRAPRTRMRQVVTRTLRPLRMLCERILFLFVEVSVVII